MRYPVVQSIRESTGFVGDQVLANDRLEQTDARAPSLLFVCTSVTADRSDKRSIGEHWKGESHE
jgi:hypothetical protein